MTKPKIANHFCAVLDSSGSMSMLRTTVVDKFNEQLREWKQQAKDSGQEITLTVVLLGSAQQASWQGKTRVLFTGTPINKVKELTQAQYWLNAGSTALMDAVALGIEELDSIPVRVKNTSYLMITITDGEENGSREYNQSSLQRLLNKKQATDKWTFAFLVPRGSARETLHYYAGVPLENIQEWEQSYSGVENYSVAVRAATSNYVQQRAAGATSSKRFFETDLSKVKTSDLKKLTDLTSRFERLKVLREVAIQPFVEEERGYYHPGYAFYELTKPEKIQRSKQIVIEDRKSKKLYGGEEARELLKLPDYEVKVDPGNHSNYKVYIQSTSVNRKLVRGTTLLYAKIDPDNFL